MEYYPFHNFHPLITSVAIEEYPEDESSFSPTNSEYCYPYNAALSPSYLVEHTNNTLADIAQLSVSDGGDLYVAQDVLYVPPNYHEMFLC